MRIEYDKEVDALYVRLQEKYVVRRIEIEKGSNRKGQLRQSKAKFTP